MSLELGTIRSLNHNPEARATESSEWRAAVQQGPQVVTRRPAVPESSNMANEGASKGGLLCLLLVCFCIGALLMVILIPMSFSDLEYYEMGFKQRRSTGTVDRSKVYYGGRHYIGVDYKFKKFKLSVHLEAFNKISIFNKDKLEVSMTCSLQYVLLPDELQSLHDSYDLDYAPVLRTTAQEAIKNAATQFSVNQFRLTRSNVSKTLFEAARVALGGTCCPKNCQLFTCYPGCQPYSTCTKKDKGLYASLKYFQLQAVDISSEEKKKFLQNVIEQEKQDTEKFKQEEKIIRKKTEQEKFVIQNTALEVSQNATAKSQLINAQASAHAKAIVEDSRNSGLQIIYSNLNITSEKHKKSLDYIRVLRNHKNAYMYSGFTTLVGREGK
eukprot:gene17302-19034_t